MPGSKTIKEHEALMGHMADRLGVDLDEVELRGAITPEDRSDMVLSCTNCTSPEDCQAWLETHAKAEDAPPYCRNSEAFKSLKND